MKNNKTVFAKEDNKSLDSNITNMVGLSPVIQKLVQEYQNWLISSESKGEVATIHVDEIASKVASIYEKIRKIVDWKEEHLIRRTAIERILKRKLLSELSGFNLLSDLEAEKIAEPLVLELIRGGHLSNDKIPRARIINVQKILEKYIYILKNNPLSKTPAPSRLKERVNFYNWILEIASCEIEETLAPPVKENALIKCMTRVMEERIRVNPSTAITEEEKRIQIYIAVHRALFHLDSPIIGYRLLKIRYPEWANLSELQLNEIAQNIFTIWEGVERDLSHPLSGEFFKICEKYDALWLLLGDVLDTLSDNPLEIPKKISEPETLENLIKKTYGKRLSTLKSRLFRMAVYSTLSIFVASGFSLFIVEVPLAKLLYGKFSPLAMVVDIMVPTLLMFLLVAIVKPPSQPNLERIITQIKNIVYQEGKKNIYEINARKRRKLILNFIIGFLYLLACCLSLGITVLVFYLARIPPSSIVLDTINVAVIVFAGLVIRQRAKEITVEEKISFWEFSLDILSVPVAKIGQWVSDRWKEYNVISVFFTALVDMPFLVFIEFVEGWSQFLKGKKAEIH